MAEGTYEYECMRAELLGIAKPDEAEFERVRAERLQQQQEELEAAEAQAVEDIEEGLKNVGGRFDELNSILSSTSKKINRLKQTARGSLTNMFGKGSVDIPDQGPSSSSQASRRNTTASSGSCGMSEAIAAANAAESDSQKLDADLNDALDDLDALQQNERAGIADIQPIIPIEKVRAAKLDIQKKMSSHLDKLDSLINKADQAEVAMSAQTKDMRKLAK